LKDLPKWVLPLAAGLVALMLFGDKLTSNAPSTPAGSVSTSSDAAGEFERIFGQSAYRQQALVDIESLAHTCSRLALILEKDANKQVDGGDPQRFKTAGQVEDARVGFREMQLIERKGGSYDGWSQAATNFLSSRLGVEDLDLTSEVRSKHIKAYRDLRDTLMEVHRRLGGS